MRNSTRYIDLELLAQTQL